MEVRPLLTAAAPFVGRELELETLRARFEAARAGNGGVVALVGEPGIGKTALAHEFARLVREEGAPVLWGACFEGEGSPSYEPWRPILRGLAGSSDRRRLPRSVGPSLAVIAEIAPDLGPFRSTETLPRLPPAEARLRLFDAVAGLLRSAVDGTLLLVVDDLHWADPASLGLLEHAGRRFGSSRILMVVTYREHLDLAHPLSQCLAELRRAQVLDGVRIDRLSRESCGELLAASFGGSVSDSLLGAVYAETKGNPFFTAELARHLREEGIERDSEADPATWRTPETVRQAVGRRVARLSPLARRMLETAAAFAGGFDFSTLQVLVSVPEEELLDALDETLSSRLIRPLAAERYEFEHAIVRHTLYDELSPSRRARVHRRIAEALEHAHAADPDYPAELATQYHLSASLPGAVHGVQFACQAADAANLAHAYARAVTFLRIARDLVRDAEAPARSDVFCRLALAEADAVMVEDATRTVEQALDALREERAEPARIAEFVQHIAWALKDAGADQDVLAPLVAPGLALAESGSLVWARLKLIEYPLELHSEGELVAGRWRGFEPEAVAAARAGSDGDYARTLELMDWHAREDVDAVDALRARLNGWQLSAATLHALTVVVRSLILQHGAFREGLGESRRLRELAERAGSIPARAYGELYLAFGELALGELDASEASAARAETLVARLGLGHRLHSSTGFYALLSAVLTRDQMVAGERSHLEDPGLLPWMVLLHESLRGFACLLSGDEEKARRLARAVTSLLERMDATTLNQNGATAFAAATAWELADAELAHPLRRLALDLIEAGVGDYPTTSNELTVARMASLLGNDEEATAYFARARESLRASGQRPLDAVACFDEALARRRERRPVPPGLLEAARTRFDELGMAAWVERVAELALAMDRTSPGGLTARETEILGLLARGRTNREIAGELFLSVHTVERHVANVYAKIRVRNRADAAAYAVRHGL